MVTKRVLLGQGRGGYGLWVSKPGFDVTTCAEDDLLFSSQAIDQSLLHVAFGVVSLGVGANTTIMFPECDRKPVVRTHWWRSVNEFYQRGLEYITGGIWIVVSVNLDSITIQNNTGQSIRVRYVVFAKPQVF